MSKKITAYMLNALVSIRDFDNPLHHLRGRHEHGGYHRTRLSMLKRGLITREDKLTDEGRAALVAAGR